MRPTPPTCAISSRPSLELQQLTEQRALGGEVRFPARLRGDAADLEVDPVEPAAVRAADEVAQLDVERSHPAGVDLERHLVDFVPEIAAAVGLEQRDFALL